MLEKIEHEGTMLAIIIRRDYDKAGVSFFTPDSFSQQLAYMHHPTGKIICTVHSIHHFKITATGTVTTIKGVPESVAIVVQ